MEPHLFKDKYNWDNLTKNIFMHQDVWGDGQLVRSHPLGQSCSLTVSRLCGAKPSRSFFGAFTLIELLLVIAIIVILAPLLMPPLANARAKAGEAVCLNNSRQIGLAVDLYVLDNDRRLPLCQNWGRAWGRDHALRRDSVWMPELLDPFIGKNTGVPSSG